MVVLVGKNRQYIAFGGLGNGRRPAGRISENPFQAINRALAIGYHKHAQSRTVVFSYKVLSSFLGLAWARKVVWDCYGDRHVE
jgi:hypothetical protein